MKATQHAHHKTLNTSIASSLNFIRKHPKKEGEKCLAYIVAVHPTPPPPIPNAIIVFFLSSPYKARAD